MWLLIAVFGLCAYKTTNLLCYIIVFCLLLLYSVKVILSILVYWGNKKDTENPSFEKPTHPIVSQQKNNSMNEQENQNTDARITALENEVKRLTMLVDRIYSYTHLGIRKPSLDNPEVLSGADPIDVDAKLQELIRNRDVIGAAKRYVELTGVGLLEAKSAVQKLLN